MWERRGHVSDEAFDRVREAEYDDAEILEITETIFTNYLNDSVRTEVEFPLVEARGSS